MGNAIRMRGERSGAGSQTVYERDNGQLVVEWYDHGENIPYESANMLVFGEAEREQLRRSLEPDAVEGFDLAQAIAARFDSYFEVRTYLDERGLPYKHEVDFTP